MASTTSATILGFVAETLGGIIIEKTVEAVWSDKNESNNAVKPETNEEELMIWLHNYIVHDFYMRKVKVHPIHHMSKKLLFLMEDSIDEYGKMRRAETKDNFIKIITYLSNLKPDLYRDADEVIESVRTNNFKIKERPEMSTSDYLLKFSWFETAIKGEYENMFAYLYTKNKYVCFTIYTIGQKNETMSTEKIREVVGSKLITNDPTESKSLDNLTEPPREELFAPSDKDDKLNKLRFFRKGK